MFQSLLDSGGLSASAIKKLCGESMHVMSIGIWLIYCLSCLEVLTEDELRVAGVIASRAVGRRVAGSPEMCPMGLIVVLKRPVEEWVVHPQGCEIVEVRFHYEMLRAYLEQTPLAARMLMPRVP